MIKFNKKSTNDIKANISQDVPLDVFAYIVIIDVHTFTCLYTNLFYTYMFQLSGE